MQTAVAGFVPVLVEFVSFILPLLSFVLAILVLAVCRSRHGFQQHGPQQQQQQVEEGTITMYSPTGLRHHLRNYIPVG